MCVVTKKDKATLRTLAKKQMEYANIPANEEKKRLWYLHNDLQINRPRVTIEEWTFAHEIARPLACETEKGREFEQQLMQNIIAYEDICDDRAIPDFFSVKRPAWFLPFGVEAKKKELKGSIAYETEHIIQTLKAAQGCQLEFSLRDIYSLGGEKGRAKHVMQLIRHLIEKHWR